MGEDENLCYGLDVSNHHDTGIVSFKFLDTDKVIHLNQLELSIFTNYILDQYNTVDTTNSLDVIKNITNRIASLESCLTSQISLINQTGEIDVDKVLCEYGKTVTDEARDNASKEIPSYGKSIMDR